MGRDPGSGVRVPLPDDKKKKRPIVGSPKGGIEHRGTMANIQSADHYAGPPKPNITALQGNEYTGKRLLSAGGAVVRTARNDLDWVGNRIKTTPQRNADYNKQLDQGPNFKKRLKNVVTAPARAVADLSKLW
jgi:hypothetical protein